jgi:hypothetical protein
MPTDDIQRISILIKEIVTHPMTFHFDICDEFFTALLHNESTIRLPKPNDASGQRLQLDRMLSELDLSWANSKPEYRPTEKYQWLTKKIEQFYKSKRDELSTKDFNDLSLYEKKLAELEELVHGTD